VRSFRLASAVGEAALMSFDVPGRSFRIRVLSGDVVRLDLLRESATHLKVSASRVRVTVRSAGLAGELDVVVGSEVVVRDTLLMV
jgi:hypothetical protein